MERGIGGKSKGACYQKMMQGGAGSIQVDCAEKRLCFLWRRNCMHVHCAKTKLSLDKLGLNVFNHGKFLPEFCVTSVSCSKKLCRRSSTFTEWSGSWFFFIQMFWNLGAPFLKLICGNSTIGYIKNISRWNAWTNTSTKWKIVHVTMSITMFNLFTMQVTVVRIEWTLGSF